MSNHTPAPWTLYDARNDGEDAFYVNHKHNYIGRVHLAPGHAAEGSANARLIAAAPELLEAMRELLTDMKIAQRNMRNAAKRDPAWEGCAEAIQPRVDAAIAAIAKATGGEA